MKSLPVFVQLLATTDLKHSCYISFLEKKRLKPVFVKPRQLICILSATHYIISEKKKIGHQDQAWYASA